MPWGRLDDSLYDHPKVEALPAGIRLACVGLWTMAISYSNRHLTDGIVSRDRIRRMGGTDRLVAALVAVGLLDTRPDGVVVHDFADYNETRASAVDRRTQMRDLGKRGGVRSGEARRLKRDGTPAVQPHDEPGRLNSRPVPSDSRPSTGLTTTPGAVARARETPEARADDAGRFAAAVDPVETLR